MKKSRFTETQIISILKEAEAGLAVNEVCRKHGISSATYDYPPEWVQLCLPDAARLVRVCPGISVRGRIKGRLSASRVKP